MTEETNVNTPQENILPDNSQTVSTDSESESGVSDTSGSEDTEVESSSTKEPSSSEEIKLASIEEKYGDMLDKFIDGTITDEDYKALNKKGISTEEFKLIAEATQIQVEKNDQMLYSFAGGHEQYKALQAYANNTLTREEQEMYNVAISHDMKLAKFVVLGLKSQMESEEGYSPSMSIEGTSSNQDSQRYNSREEYLKEATSFKYRKDPAFKSEVDSKRSRSGF